MEGHVGNIEWSIVRVKGYLLFEPPITNHPLYANESINYTYIEYRMALKRKPDFYVNTLVVPSLLLSWLGAVIFLLPSECGEKLSFSITLFLALYINQVIVSEFLPPSADTYPLIAKFYMLISIILGGSIFLTAVILMFHFRLNHATPQPKTLSYWLFRILEKIGSLSLVGTGKSKRTKKVKLNPNVKQLTAKTSRGANSSPNDADYIELKQAASPSHNDNLQPISTISLAKEMSENGTKSMKTGNNSPDQIGAMTYNEQISPSKSELNVRPCIEHDRPADIQASSESISIPVPSYEAYLQNKENASAKIHEKRTSEKSQEETDINLPRSQSANSEIASGSANGAKRVMNCSPRIEEYLGDILEKLDIVAKDDTAEVSLKRWRTLASGLDRLFFLSYLIIMGITTMYFFLLVVSVEKVKDNMDFDEILNNLDH